MNGPRVLVVDDSDLTRAMLVRTLERAGFEVLTASDGAEGAVVALREQPDVVVTDLEMPIMDGYHLLRLIKSDPASSHIPVLILTSHGEAPSRFWGLQTGADAYLTKDFKPAQLINAVETLAASVQTNPRAIHAAPQGPLDVLARVARHLDTSLMQATLINALLARGMAATDTHAASLCALQTIGEVVDAPLLGVAISEPELVTLHMMLMQPVPAPWVDACSNAIIASLPVSPTASVDAQVSGKRDGTIKLDPADLLFFPLALRNARGTLAVLPREPDQFAHVSRHLVQSLTDHLAVLLDNARLYQRLQELSTNDGLTRLLNHRAIYERLEEELKRAQRFRHPLTVVICDLDFFKRVNDSHGHLAGDAVLRLSASVFRHALRTSDILGRYGGEEFLAVLPESDLDAGRQAAERLRQALSDDAIPLPAGGTINITGSFGVASMRELPYPVTPDALVALADNRLYLAKAAGRNCVRP